MLIAQEGYRTLHKYLPYLTHALNGLYMLKREGAYKAKVTASLKVSSRKSVEWPKDMLFATKIGVEVGGRILTFIPDSTISLNRDDHKTNNSTLVDAGYALVASVSRLSDFIGVTNVYYSGSAPGLNVGSLVARRFKINEESREFQLDSTLSCKNVHIEYISTGLKPSSETLISVHSSTALKEWIWYQESKFKFGAAAAETRAREQDYLHELSESIMAQSDLSWNGIMDALSQSMTSSIDQ
jgi:hypothetical protein